MDCQTAIEYINLYADGMLSKKETERLLSHIGSCSKCKKDLDDIIAVKKALSGLGEMEPPVGLALSAIKKAKKRKIPVFAYASAGVAAVIALVAFFSSNIFNDSNYRLDKAAHPSVYSQEVAGGSAVQEECAPQEASMNDLALAPAPSPAATTEPLEKTDDGDSVVMRSASMPYIHVPDEVSENFRQLLEDFLSENGIEYERSENGDQYTISFKITEDKLEGLKSLIKDSFYKESYQDESTKYEEELKAGPVSFIFSK